LLMVSFLENILYFCGLNDGSMVLLHHANPLVSGKCSGTPYPLFCKSFLLRNFILFLLLGIFKKVKFQFIKSSLLAQFIKSRTSPPTPHPPLLNFNNVMLFISQFFLLKKNCKCFKVP
jgi:hypothetical protein